MPADLAEAQVDPPVAGFEAFLAAVRGARLDIPDLVEMRAFGLGHRWILSLGRY
jgi:hypothetical protein